MPHAGPRTRLILLGVGGGPRPRTASSAPAQVIVVGDAAYVVDCGNGVARQLVSAGVALPRLRHVFLTHHHSDHNADYGNLLLLAWASGLGTRVDTWGPPPLERITRLFFEMSAYDIEVRIADEGRVALAPLRQLVDVVEDCGRVAAAAGVRTLVLSHLVPADDPSVTDRMWLDAATAHFKGEVIVGKDLMEI